MAIRPLCSLREPNLGALIIEGKTKRVYHLKDQPKLCYVESKDMITAGDGAKANELEGKAEISNATNARVFELLASAGIETAFVEAHGPKSFLAKKCSMVPIEWVTRRLATGSFLRRNPGVRECHRFSPPLLETFYKDDANHDPQWSEQQIVSAGFELGGVKIGQLEYDTMAATTLAVFEILERAWATRDCVLVDMKIEFGVGPDGEILLADIIDNDSWRLWPKGDKSQMKDKQVYRNLAASATEADLQKIKMNFAWVAEEAALLLAAPSAKSHCVVFLGSPSDLEHGRQIAKQARELGLEAEIRVTSAHKSTEDTLKILAEYAGKKVVLIGVAGRSNGLGLVLSGNGEFPVINCPPGKAQDLEQDIWSSLKVPSGLGCTTCIYPQSAALAAAQIHALTDHRVWSRLRARRLNTLVALKRADRPEV
uniref:PurE domain-containing protein n=1 Tax=Trichogramma kaykai TaxID=54128 RepID=A0ABD2XMY1_9HYME